MICRYKIICMKRITLLVGFLCAILATSCNKEKECYDEALYQQHKDDLCTMDCPGVIGCDGKTYCNECVARTKGIRLR